MTEEEKATEYASNLKAKDFIAKPKEIVAYFAYLAGLHEGQPKWHDLRKDPNDLPKVTKEYITNIGVMTFDRLKDRHLWTTPLCDACDYCEEVTDEVIAWCEIPQFKE